MAKRFCDTEIWDKEWFMNLKPKLKCLVKYVHDKCDVAGFWEPNWTLANTYVGEKVNESDLLKIDGGNQFKKLETGKIYCIGFINFQYGQLSEKCHPHKKILGILSKEGLNDNFLLGYSKGTLRVLSTLQDKEEDMDKDKEEEKEKEEEKDPQKKLIFPYTSDSFLIKWNVLSNMKKWKRKSFEALQQALHLLGDNTEPDAIKMMENAIAGEWQGIFELKKSAHGNNKNGFNNGKDRATAILEEAERRSNSS